MQDPVTPKASASDCAATVPTTPVRQLLASGAIGRDPAGFVTLRTSDVSYRDGAEDEVLALVTSTPDRASYSDAMVRRAQGWAQRYHSDPTRANVLRALDLPHRAAVLEIGCGSGAITRYLGETCAAVDSVEPMPARAAAAAARCADQHNVTVYVGEAADIPRVAAYNVIVVIGVLEYVGWGAADRAKYDEFLADCYARLLPGGTLIVAIENQLGVKYLVGAPEDHTRGTFDSLENYPRGGHARTFSRAELTTMMTDAGFQVQALGAFPDYKLTRVVMGDFPEEAASLAARLPRFPSPDWMGKRPRLASEQVVWETLVTAGLATDCANSLLMLGVKPADPQRETGTHMTPPDAAATTSASNVAPASEPTPLWPADRCAVFYSSHRRPELMAATRVLRIDQPAAQNAPGHVINNIGNGATAPASSVMFERTALLADPRPVPGITLHTGTAPYVAGRDMTQVLAAELIEAGELSVAQPWLAKWLRVLDEAFASGAAESGSAFDLVPHNLVVGDDGELTAIDEELHIPQVGREHIVARGVYHLAKAVTARVPARYCAPARTVRQVMSVWGEAAGLSAGGAWIEAFVDQEAAVQARVRDRRPLAAAAPDNSAEAWAEWVATVRVGIARSVDRKLSDLPFGDRLPDRHARLRKKATGLQQQRDAARAENARLEKQVAALRARSLRGRIKRVAGVLLPRGTRRRAWVVRLVRKVRGR